MPERENTPLVPMIHLDGRVAALPRAEWSLRVTRPAYTCVLDDERSRRRGTDSASAPAIRTPQCGDLGQILGLKPQGSLGSFQTLLDGAHASTARVGLGGLARLTQEISLRFTDADNACFGARFSHQFAMRFHLSNCWDRPVLARWVPLPRHATARNPWYARF